jgi:hypothetical protein
MGEPKWVEGKFEGALWFDGVDDHVLVPHAEILCVEEEVTVMAWINTERYIVALCFANPDSPTLGGRHGADRREGA